MKKNRKEEKSLGKIYDHIVFVCVCDIVFVCVCDMRWSTFDTCPDNATVHLLCHMATNDPIVTWSYI